jgi:DNA-binding transcriptional LysR family regulator
MDLTERIGIRFKLRDLYILLAVAEWKSMAKAARHLAVSQPVVSRAISDLEGKFGVKIFDRTPQGVEPTIYGRTLLDRGLAVFDELRGSVKDIKFLSDATGGELRIGSTPSITAGLLPVILDRLSAQRPRMSFQVKVGDAALLYHHDLRERRIDVLFGRLIAGPDDDVYSEVLFDDSIVVVASADNPWSRRRKITLEDLIGAPWTMPPTDSYPANLIADAFRQSGLQPPHLNVTSHAIELHLALLATGRFISLLPKSLVALRGSQLGIKILPVELPIPTHPFGFRTLKYRTLGPVATLFIESARTVAKAVVAKSSSRQR